MPRTQRQKMREGARKWKGPPRVGFVFECFFARSIHFSLLR